MAIEKKEELLFHWGTEGSGSELYKITSGRKVTFVNRFTFFDIDKDDNETWQNCERQYDSFAAYWIEFTEHPHWLHYHPVFVHPDYKPFVREFLIEIPQDSLTKGELLKLMYWLEEIVNES